MPFSLFGGRARAAPEAKASAVGGLVALHGAGRAAWTPRDATSLARVGYCGNVVAFRCVRMIAEAAAATPFRAAEGGAALAEHPVLDLLERPNRGQDGVALREAFYGHLLLAGDAYLEAASGPSSAAPAELHVLRPDRMKVVPGRDGWPQSYEYRVGPKTHRFDMDGDAPPILHLQAFHPLDDHYGMSPLEAAAASIDVHDAAARWAKALLDNAARPSGAVIYRAPDGRSAMSDEQYRRLVDELEANHQGARNAGRPMLLEGGLDWKPMGFSPSEMEFLETKNAAAREIALAFGVPPMLLGIPGDNTYANYQEANRAFFRQTVAPLAARAASAIAAWLGSRWGGAVRLTADLENVPALASERAARWTRIADAAFLTDEEKRELLGFPPRAASGRR